MARPHRLMRLAALMSYVTERSVATDDDGEAEETGAPTQPRKQKEPQQDAGQGQLQPLGHGGKFELPFVVLEPPDLNHADQGQEQQQDERPPTRTGAAGGGGRRAPQPSPGPCPPPRRHRDRSGAVAVRPRRNWDSTCLRLDRGPVTVTT